MWEYKKMLQYPVNIKSKDVKFVKALITQYGGPYGELGAALRYLIKDILCQMIKEKHY